MVEPLVQPARQVWVWKAGHVGRALAAVLAPLPGLALTWTDTAPDRFPPDPPAGVALCVAPDPAALAAAAPAGAEHLILTCSHALDLALCHALLSRGCRSLGLIGSASKRARFRGRLAALGHAPARDRPHRLPDRRSRPRQAPPKAIAGAVAAALLPPPPPPRRAAGGMTRAPRPAHPRGADPARRAGRSAAPGAGGDRCGGAAPGGRAALKRPVRAVARDTGSATGRSLGPAPLRSVRRRAWLSMPDRPKAGKAAVATPLRPDRGRRPRPQTKSGGRPARSATATGRRRAAATDRSRPTCRRGKSRFGLDPPQRPTPRPRCRGGPAGRPTAPLHAA